MEPLGLSRTDVTDFSARVLNFETVMVWHGMVILSKVNVSKCCTDTRTETGKLIDWATNSNSTVEAACTSLWLGSRFMAGQPTPP